MLRARQLRKCCIEKKVVHVTFNQRQKTARAICITKHTRAREENQSSVGLMGQSVNGKSDQDG